MRNTYRILPMWEPRSCSQTHMRAIRAHMQTYRNHLIQAITRDYMRLAPVMGVSEQFTQTVMLPTPLTQTGCHRRVMQRQAQFTLHAGVVQPA